MYLLNTKYNCQLLRPVQGFPLLRLLWADLTSKGSSLASLLTKLPYHCPCGTPLDLSSSQCISTYMPRLKNSADSPQPYQYGCFAWTSMALQTSSVRPNIYRSDTSTSGTRIPYGLYDSLCTLRQYCSRDAVLTAEKQSLISHSAKGATLDTGGWLSLTRQGLTPCKMHQALLDALTLLLWGGCT
jgi:hypothetical protein